MLSRGLLLLSATVIHARLDIANPGCHDATIAWLRVQAVSDEPETRRSARYLLRKHGYEIPDDARPPPRRRDPLRPRSPRRRDAEVAPAAAQSKGAIVVDASSRVSSSHV